MEFEWDFSKEMDNIRKHGVSFVEAVESFSDPDGFQMSDVKHSAEESRLYWVGKCKSGRILTTRFTRRGNVIRMIGSGVWRKFKRIYDERAKTD